MKTRFNRITGYRRISAVILLLSLSAAAISAYSDPEWDPLSYKGNFFVMLEPAGPFEPDVYDEDKALKQLLDEARYVFSGMIYGFEFDYIPKDIDREIDEEFSLKPVYTLPWGDQRLSVSTGAYEDGRYTAELRYDVSEEQMPWVSSWDTNILPDVTAAGEGSLYEGFEGKKEAIENSVKESLRSYLRPRIYDKPSRITGKARLAGIPYIIMDEGKYRCTAKITLRIDEILEYRAY